MPDGDGRMGRFPLERAAEEKREIGPPVAGSYDGRGRKGEQELGMQFANGFPVVWSLAELVAYPTQNRAEPELAPQRIMTNLKWRAQARRAAVADPNDGGSVGGSTKTGGQGLVSGTFSIWRRRKASNR